MPLSIIQSPDIRCLYTVPEPKIQYAGQAPIMVRVIFFMTDSSKILFFITGFQITIPGGNSTHLEA